MIDQLNISSLFLYFSLEIINRQTTYDSGILRQDYGIIRALPMEHTVRCLPIESLAEWYIYRNGLKRAGLITASDRIVRAVYSCNSWIWILPI